MIDGGVGRFASMYLCRMYLTRASIGKPHKEEVARDS